jgi:hypothetical protein
MTKPSWQDFGTHDESAVPELWDGVAFAAAPCLGPTGLRLHDHSRRVNWGTLTNMDAATDWVVDGGQYALDFDGTDDHIPTRVVPGITGSVTFSAWFKSRDVTNTRAIFSDSNSTGASINFHMETSSGRLSILWGANPYFRPSGATALATNQFYHAVITRSGTAGSWRARMYLDGKNDYDNTTSINPGTSNTLTIGRAGEFNSLYANLSALDDVIVWNRELQPNEVARLYQLGRGGILKRRRRRRVYAEQAGFRAHYRSQRAQLIGGGLR